MASIFTLGRAALRFIGIADDFGDTARAVKAASNFATGNTGGDTVNLERIRRIAAAILQIVGPFLAKKPEDRPAFLADKRALERVNNVYYYRLPDTATKDQFEKIFGEVWGAICEKLGVRQVPLPQQGKKGQPPNQPRQQPQQAANPLRDIPEVDLFSAVQICLGKDALVKDREVHRATNPPPRTVAPPSNEGDEIIKRGVERLRQATLTEQAGAKVLKGIGLAASVLKVINDTNEQIDREEGQ